MEYVKRTLKAMLLLASLPLFACSPPIKPLTCEVHLNSGNGGSIDVSRIDPNPALPFPDRPLHIFWHPPADGASMDLFVDYPKATLRDFGDSNGGRIQFAPGVSSNVKQFQALVSDESAQSLRFDADPDFGPEQGDFIFSADSSSGKGVTAMIKEGKSIKVVILKDGKSVASESFDTSATVGRDQLLAQARRLVEGADPRFCRPE